MKIPKTTAEIVKWVVKALGLILLVLVIWMGSGLDYLTTISGTNADPTSITRYDGAGDHKTAFVFFGGAQASATAESAPLRNLWLQHADVVIVEYNRIHFDGSQTAQDTYQKLRGWGYQKVILDGASEGGLVATDMIDCDLQDKQATTHLQFAVMMQDAPSNLDDLYQRDTANNWASAWWPGQVSNFLLTWIFWGINFNPPPRDQLGTDVDDAQLAAQYDASGTYPLSGEMDEIRYIQGHAKIDAQTYYQIPLIYFRSGHDGIVKPTAADNWAAAFQPATIINVEQASHADFVEHPDAWRRAFEAGFKDLPAGW